MKATRLSVTPRMPNIRPNSSVPITFDIIDLMAIAFVLMNKSMVVPA